MKGMCGYLGVYAPAKAPLDDKSTEKLRQDSQRLAHRGNSSRGELVTSGAALFHHRLAFRDLTEGRQPLSDSQNRATILFNGELYGFRALRDRLGARYEFRTRSDTEVILAAYLEYGEKLLDHFDGEYSFVIQDNRDGNLLAARDPFGVKPLFWGADATMPGASTDLRIYRPRYMLSAPGRLHFASEIKGLGLPLRWDARGLNRQFLSLFEEMGTSFEGVYSLPPGGLLTAVPRGKGWDVQLDRKISKRRATRPGHQRSIEESASELREILSRTVESKLDSDVPLGAYLSGGVDSRIAAFEMGKAGATIETFTVGFEGEDYDETQDVSRFLRAFPNLKGRAFRTSNELLEYAYPHAIYASELIQPYTNGSAKWWLSRFARRHVRGVLTGDGADEIFCGYPSYRYLAWWSFYRRNPTAARASLFAERVIGQKQKFWEKGLSSRPDGQDLEESVKTLGWAHPLYAQITGAALLWDRPDEVLAAEKNSLLSYVDIDRDGSPLTQWQNYFLHTHFPTHVLNWVGDRMEMANTLEGRPIFLSRPILEFMRAEPDSHLVRGMRDKAVLRKAYEGDLKSFAAVPKKQFNAPFLLDGPLGRDFLSDKALKETGLIDPALVRKAEASLRGKTDPLQESFTRIFLQNCLVTQMLDRYLVRGQAPARDLAFEESVLDQRTVEL